MGLKSGSQDAGLDGARNDGARCEEEQPADAPSDAGDANANDASEPEPESERPAAESLPYTLRRRTVNAGREQVPFFLRGDVVAAEDDLRETLEATLGEHVYKSDYREAAMVLAQRNPDLLADVLREWGYDLDGT